MRTRTILLSGEQLYHYLDANLHPTHTVWFNTLLAILVILAARGAYSASDQMYVCMMDDPGRQYEQQNSGEPCLTRSLC